ncbi:MAG: alpha/beta fold hydrolase [Propionibacteriales bacterium]|nr:alpha/beta fold hydrolase [Propionibacteriales bacterium]
MTDGGGLDDLWFRPLNAARQDAPLLVVLPHAGGSASYYRPLGALLPEVEVWAVQYPGRQDRYGEEQLPSIDRLADEVAARLSSQAAERSLALFGHSMGAVVAFEVTRRLEGLGVAVAHLVVSGRGAPDWTPPPGGPTDDDALVTELLRLSGTHAAVLDDPDLLALVLPAVRADYAIVREYRASADARVATSLTVLHARDDPLVPAEALDGWRDASSGPVSFLAFLGGHFYLVERAAEVADVLRRAASG